MNVLQMKMSILRFDVRLLESDAFKAVIEQRGLLVSNHALSACQFPLLVQKSTQFPSDCRIRTGCIECKADDTCRIDSSGDVPIPSWRSAADAGASKVSVEEFFSVILFRQPWGSRPPHPMEI